MAILVTGAAGFIGFHVATALLARGEQVIGLDNLNEYYDLQLKLARLTELQKSPGFKFLPLNLVDREPCSHALKDSGEITGVVHLAAQAGVRFSLQNPYAYIESNVMGQVVLLELARSWPNLKHFVYASSSSIYGSGSTLPFALTDRAETPVSLYAATKRMDELLGHTYAHLYQLPLTGLRFFTVYGPWGRPDMAVYLFTKALFEGTPIALNNNGNMQRDFTYIDDIVAGVLAVLDKPPATTPPHAVYNLGNHRSEPLGRLVSLLEQATGRKAIIEAKPIPAGDVLATYADISATTRDFGFVPKTTLDDGIPRFVDWYRAYHQR